MVKRQAKYSMIFQEQEKFVEEFVKKKSQKTTIMEGKYLDLFGLDFFEDIYFTVCGSRKCYFVIPFVNKLARKYDQIEKELVLSEEKDRVKKLKFFDQLEELFSEFKEDFETEMTEIYSYSNDFKRVYRVGNFIADQARKVVDIMFDSNTNEAHFWCFKFLEEIGKFRRKIAFKGYQRIAKFLVKQDEIDTKLFRSFALSYAKIQAKLKSNYDVKLLKLLGSNVDKFVGERESLKIFASIYK